MVRIHLNLPVYVWLHDQVTQLHAQSTLVITRSALSKAMQNYLPINCLDALVLDLVCTDL